MFSRIMVPLDGSPLAEAVLPYATLLAKACSAQIDLVSVLDTGGLHAEPQHQATIDQVAERAQLEAETYLNDVTNRLEAQKLTVQSNVLLGRPAETLASYAESSGADLIAMSTHGRSGIGRWLIGSVTDRVLHLSSIPMLIIRPAETAPAAEPRIGTILVPLDGSNLSESALPYARDLARRLRARVVLVQALEQALGAVGDLASEPMLIDVTADAEAAAKHRLSGIADGLRAGNLICEVIVLTGQPAASIVELASHQSDGMIVMTSHGRSGLGRAFLGSVTDRVVQGSRGPVLVIRPPQPT